MTQTKNILITGAAGGFGSELALQLSRRAATENLELILLDNNEPGLDQLADRIEAENDYQALIYPLDLETATIDQYTQLAEAMNSQLGQLDILIHAAARFKNLAPMVHAEPVEWLRVMQTNLNGPWLLSRCCQPLLKQAGQSKMIFLLEDLETMAEPNWGSYGVSKVALNALVSQLQGELDADGIEVKGINPGPMRTNLRASAWMPSSYDPAIPVADVAEHFIHWLNSDQPWQVPEKK